MTIPKQAIDAAAKAIADSIGHGMSEKCFDHARAALTAAAPYMSEVKVKQLEWVDTGQRGFLETSYFAISGTLQHTCSPWKKGEGPFPEHYAISFREHEPRPWVLRYCVGNNGLSGLADSFATPEAAKAAAQADYEKRILSALEPSSTPEPIGYLFQHEDTGLEQVVEVQQVEWGFEKNNPRWQKICPVYSVPVSQPSSAREQALEEEDQIDALRFQAFKTNSDADRQAYFDAVSKWFQGRYIRAIKSQPSSAREQVLEEAAKMAEGNSRLFDHQAALAECRDCESGFHSGRVAAAAAIRSLSSQPVAGECKGEWREIEISHPLKGRRVSPAYFPVTGEVCEVSGPNCDDGKGYTWGETTVLWQNEMFVLFGKAGYWPVLHKHEHVLFRPLPASPGASDTRPTGGTNHGA